MIRRTNVIGAVAVFVVSLGSTSWGEVGYPSGIQDFEGLTVGADLLTALPTWVVVNTSAQPNDFTVVVAKDVLSRCGSCRFLRSTDVDGAAVQNRYYSPPVVKQAETMYRWTQYIMLENTPPGGADTKPKLTIQHRDMANVFQNAWGIEFTATGANLIVLGIGGAAGSMPLYPLSGATAVGEWVKLDLVVDFAGDTVSATANNGTPVSLPINLVATANENEFRFCYRGEGAGNVQTMRVDDVAVCVGNATMCPVAPVCTDLGAGCPAVSAPGVMAMAGLIFAASCVALSRRRRIVAQAGV